MNYLVRRIFFTVIISVCVLSALQAQPFGGANVNSFPVDDPIIKNIWKEAMDSSRLELLAHQLLDVVGPRLVGSPQMQKANDWAVKTYAAWGIEAKNEKWGEWRGWDRGVTHIDLLQPRVRTLEGTMLAWSPGTKKEGITTGLVILDNAPDSIAFLKWLPTVKGKFVLVSQPQITGRPDKNWEEFALKESFDSLKAQRTRMTEAWNLRIKHTGFRADTLPNILEQAGALGVITSRWSQGWGVDKIFGCTTKNAPVVDISLEDYNLLYRLVENGDQPVVRIVAESKFLGAVPTHNTIGTI
ncbi:MAG: peptidase M28, partial [Ignavibacteriales bacterium]|nr:peptidase M28 [Ignavibacteriales bacterium]